MAWVNVTEADILTRMTGTELNTFRSVAKAPGQDDPVAGVIAQNVNVVRGYIAGCERNVLGPENTIPDKLLGTCLALIVIDIMARAAGRIMDPSEVRRDAARQARSTLTDVSRCTLAIEKPDEQSTEIIQNFTPSFNGRRPHFKRWQQEGI